MFYNNIAFWVCLVGALLFAFCSAVGKYADLKEAARLMFFAGLLAILLGKI